MISLVHRRYVNVKKGDLQRYKWWFNATVSENLCGTYEKNSIDYAFLKNKPDFQEKFCTLLVLIIDISMC